MACKKCGGNSGHHKPGCGMSPAVLQINNKDCTLFHSVTIPAIMGDETENPPANGLYKNVLLYYEASGNAYFYSSDGIPTKLTYATTDYNALTNKPTVNGVTLEGALTPTNLGININDATLTIKQGDTTLGTFSANASENVEVNIPEGGADEPIYITLGFPQTGVWNFWTHGMNIDYDETTASGRSMATRMVPEVTFSGSGVSYTAEEVFNMLEDGKDVVFMNVPLGWRGDGTNGGVTAPQYNTDRLRLTSRVSMNEEQGTLTTYSGITLSDIILGTIPVSLPIGYGMIRLPRSDGSYLYAFVTQGIDTFTPPV